MANEWVPQFTRVGFEKSRIPDHLYEMILTEYEEMKKTPTTPEVCEPVTSNIFFWFLNPYLQLFYRASLTAREFMNQMINVLQWRIAKFTWCGWGSNIYTSMSIRITPVSDRVQQHLREDILPLAESWAGVSLEHTSTYGIRRYTNGSWLISHIDRSQLSLKVYHSFMQYFQVHNPCYLGHPEHRTVC